MRRSEPALRRLLVPPLLGLVALFVGLQILHTTTAPSADVGPPAAAQAELPPVADVVPRCQRDRTGPVVDGGTVRPDELSELRRQLDELLEGHRVTSTQVLGCPAAFDGRSVVFTGELVGDLLARDGGAWVLVNDDDYALEVGPLPAHRDRRGTNSGLSVWLPDRLHGLVTGLGGPGRRGDLVRVEGVVRRADPDDGGGLTLRADTLQVLAPSVRVHEPFDVAQAWSAAAALALAAGVWSARRLRADR